MYTFDNVRNVDTINDNSGLHDYNYDDLYRLTQAIHPAGLGIPALESYGYDNVGNREDPGDSLLYEYDANNRITKSPSIINYGYDSDGNTTSKTGGFIFTYNHDNRLTSYTDGTINASYNYDTAGRRTNKTVDGITTWYLWDGTSLLAEYDNSGSQLKRYAYLSNQIAPVQMAMGSSIYDIHSDHLQTPKRLTDSGRNTVWQANYESFGKVNLAVNIVEFNLRFPGQYYDQESELHYNYFRDYDPSIGRYITSDPIGLYGGINTYVYAKNNPITKFDRFGLLTPAGLVAGAACLAFDAYLVADDVSDLAEALESFADTQKQISDLQKKSDCENDAIKKSEIDIKIQELTLKNSLSIAADSASAVATAGQLAIGAGICYAIASAF